MKNWPLNSINALGLYKPDTITCVEPPSRAMRLTSLLQHGSRRLLSQYSDSPLSTMPLGILLPAIEATNTVGAQAPAALQLLQALHDVPAGSAP